MKGENKIDTPLEEIEYLKQKIAELESSVSGKEKKEAVKEAVVEHAQKLPEEALSEEYQLGQEEVKERAERISGLNTEEGIHDKQIQELLDLSQEKGILNAISVVRHLEDAHLEDEFHDSLVKYLSGLEEYKAPKKVKKVLDFVLYEVTLPQEKPGEEQKDFKEFVAVMEQFYVGMLALNSHFVLEVGLSFSGDEVVVYCAVPRDKSQLFEKQVQGLFHEAKLTVKEGDYNIFKPEGFSLGSVLNLKKNAVLPIKTYDKFEVDPLQVVINTFSKLQKEGEGAALQIIVSPSDHACDSLNKKAKGAALSVRKGESFEEALKSAGLGSGFSGVVKELVFGQKKQVEGEEKAEPKAIDEELATFLESKAAHKIIKSNIRLVVSSEDKEKAKSILGELESAFLQFEEPQGNSFSFTRPRGKGLEKLLYDFSFRIPENKDVLLLSTAELSTVFHFPLGLTSVAAPQLKYAKTKESARPLDLSEAGLLLGKNVYRGEERYVYIKDDDRRRHFYVIGQTGTGKSVLLKNMAVQDIEDNKGVCFIDPHGSDLQDILSRIPKGRVEDLIYFNPGDTARPMGLNMLEYNPDYPEQKTFIVNELLGIFNKLFDMKTAGGPMFEQYFRHSVMLVMDDPQSGNTLFEVSKVLTNKEFRDLKLSRSQNPTVKTFWKETAEKAGGEAALQNMVPYITSKFDTFLANEIMRPIIGQEKSAFNFREVMDQGKILLVNLSKGRLGDINSNLIGLIIVGKLLMASLSRVDVSEDKRRDFYLYIDEFQNVTTDSISTILSEARKYRLNLTIGHQFIAQLEEEIKKSVFGNVGSMSAFRVGAEDAEFLEKQFEPVFNSHDLMNIDNYNAYLKILVNGQTSRPFNIQTLPFQKGDEVFGEEIAKLSSFKFGRDRAEVEEEINKKYNS